MLCGAAYGSNMYIKADNIYKIDDQALTISQSILEHSENRKVRAILPNNENIVYGIRQYTGDIVVAGVFGRNL